MQLRDKSSNITSTRYPRFPYSLWVYACQSIQVSFRNGLYCRYDRLHTQTRDVSLRAVSAVHIPVGDSYRLFAVPKCYSVTVGSERLTDWHSREEAWCCMLCCSIMSYYTRREVYGVSYSESIWTGTIYHAIVARFQSFNQPRWYFCRGVWKLCATIRPEADISHVFPLQWNAFEVSVSVSKTDTATSPHQFCLACQNRKCENGKLWV